MAEILQSCRESTFASNYFCNLFFLLSPPSNFTQGMLHFSLLWTKSHTHWLLHGKHATMICTDHVKSGCTISLPSWPIKMAVTVIALICRGQRERLGFPLLNFLPNTYKVYSPKTAMAYLLQVCKQLLRVIFGEQRLHRRVTDVCHPGWEWHPEGGGRSGGSAPVTVATWVVQDYLATSGGGSYSRDVNM